MPVSSHVQGLINGYSPLLVHFCERRRNLMRALASANIIISRSAAPPQALLYEANRVAEILVGRRAS